MHYKERYLPLMIIINCMLLFFVSACTLAQRHAVLPSASSSISSSSSRAALSSGYNLGYSAGCSYARNPQKIQKNWQKDYREKYNADPDFRHGWKSGFAACGRRINTDIHQTLPDQFSMKPGSRSGI